MYNNDRNAAFKLEMAGAVVWFHELSRVKKATAK
jgi:hypothetical protein